MEVLLSLFYRQGIIYCTYVKQLAPGQNQTHRTLNRRLFSSRDFNLEKIHTRYVLAAKIIIKW